MFEGGRLESDREHSFREIHDSFDKYRKVVDDVAMLKFCGKVKEVIGSLVVSEGPFAKLGDICRIYKNDDTYIDAEVIGFRNQDVLLSTYGSVNGITFGNMVYSSDKPLSIICSNKILGTVLNDRNLEELFWSSIQSLSQEIC